MITGTNTYISGGSMSRYTDPAIQALLSDDNLRRLVHDGARSLRRMFPALAYDETNG